MTAAGREAVLALARALATFATLATCAALAIACREPPSITGLPEARLLGEDPAGIDGVAAGEAGVVWTTVVGDDQSGAGRVARWRRRDDQITPIALERAAPRAPLLGHARAYWVERGLDDAPVLYGCAHDGTVSRAVRVPASLLPSATARLVPLVELVDGTLVLSASGGGAVWLVRVHPDDDTRAARVAILPMDSTPAVSATATFVVLTGLRGRTPVAMTLSTEELAADTDVAPLPIEVPTLRLLGAMLASDDAYYWLDPGEEELPPRLRRKALVGGGVRALVELPRGVGGLVLTPAGELWLRGRHTLIRVTEDGASSRYAVAYDPIELRADLDGLVVLAAGDGGGAQRVLLQPYPLD